MKVENEEIQMANCHKHLEEGGGEKFMAWTFKLLKLAGWDAKNDIKIYADERMFNLFKDGKEPEDIVQKRGK